MLKFVMINILSVFGGKSLSLRKVQHDGYVLLLWVSQETLVIFLKQKRGRG
jgi:hypothetical protein